MDDEVGEALPRGIGAGAAWMVGAPVVRLCSSLLWLEQEEEERERKQSRAPGEDKGAPMQRARIAGSDVWGSTAWAHGMGAGVGETRCDQRWEMKLMRGAHLAVRVATGSGCRSGRDRSR